VHESPRDDDLGLDRRGVHRPDDLCTAANPLFNMNKDQLQLPEIFERSVDMTSVARSWSDSLNMFGTGSPLPNALSGTIVPHGASNAQSMLQEPVADGQEEVDVDLQKQRLELEAERKLKELKGELKELEGKRDTAFKASKDTNETNDKACHQKQIASAEKQIEVQQLLVNAIVAEMTSEVQGIGESRRSLMHHDCSCTQPSASTPPSLPHMSDWGCG